MNSYKRSIWKFISLINIHYIPLQVLYNLNLDINLEAKVFPFVSYDLDPVSRGSINIRTGAIVGIPHIFAYNSPTDVKKELFKIYNDYSYSEINWESGTGKAFLESLVLSDQAKMFGIARELKYAQSYGPHIEATLRSLSGVYRTLNFCCTAIFAAAEATVKKGVFTRSPAAQRRGRVVHCLTSHPFSFHQSIAVQQNFKSVVCHKIAARVLLQAICCRPDKRPHCAQCPTDFTARQKPRCSKKIVSGKRYFRFAMHL